MNATKTAIRPSTHEAIIAAALELFNANANTSMSEIAVRAGVGRATLHRHFRTREDLVRVLGEQALAATEAAVRAIDSTDRDALSRLRGMFQAVIPLGAQYAFLSTEHVSDEVARSRYREQIDWVRELVGALRADGVVATDIPASWAVAQIDQLIWVAWREVSAGRLALADAPDLAVRTLINGLGERNQ